MAQYVNRETIAPVLPTFSNAVQPLQKVMWEVASPPTFCWRLKLWRRMIKNPEWRRLLVRLQRWCMYSCFPQTPTPHCRSPTRMGLFRSVLICFTMQVFTLHAFKHGQQFPLVYFLLPGKSREAYNTSFILLKEAAQNIGLKVEHQRVLADFELPLQQSVAVCFPQAEKKGCHFH